ncbi:MAG: right-handed parallel beta-helix repeat-containing protein [Planctomycetota bacterium]|jgi:hypothetical protein
MKKASLISVALLLVLTGQAQSHWPPTDPATILPQNPTRSDVVTITLSGVWCSICIPNASAVSVVGNSVYFDVITRYPEDLVCILIPAAWQLTQFVGPLPPGKYTVYTRWLVEYTSVPWSVQNDTYIPIAEFTVTGQYYYVAVDGNDSNNGLIQKGIDTAVNGDTVMVLPGTYVGDIEFLGKNITLTSADPMDANIVANTIIDGNDANSAITFSGTESPNCTLTGFKIDGTIFGFDESVDPDGENHTHATITHCLVQGSLLPCGLAVYACDGTISNCIIADNGTNGACLIASVAECHGLIKNCTIVNNEAGIIIGSIGAGGSATIQNCIIYHNQGFQVGLRTAATLNISYCDVEGGLDGIDASEAVNWGPGNMDADPCFARTGYWPEPLEVVEGDYHLQSSAGRWDPNSETWVTDGNTSRGIDAGNPGSPPGDEPAPNGNRINMGAYGGTAEASKSPARWALLSDLTNDGKMNHDDLGVFVGYWLESGENLPSDLDRNQSVDSTDYAIFAGQWSDAYVAEPTIAYEVSPCDPNQVQDSSGPRFRAWAVGSYIHFEDMINANCCADEIELQMTVEGNQITIREIEHLTIPCDCMCDFPTTAILGPFEDGIYLVEVIDIYGSSLGIVIVIIGGLPEPGITYQVGDCNEGASASLFLAEQPDDTRFTVTVDGQCIHFEDMMVANCCPDELELQMTVEGNLITIYEIEHTTMPCHCICEYPVTATLGPFEPGTYTLEVYQHNYSADPVLIGSTTVTIG